MWYFVWRINVGKRSGNPYGRDPGGALEKSVLLIKYGFVFFCIVELDNDSFGEFVARAVRVEPISGFVITPHALFEMKRRRLSEEVVGKVLADPDQRIEVRPGRHVLQSRVSMKGRTYLVRVFVDIEATPAEVVTAYRTSKVEKYWRNGP